MAILRNREVQITGPAPEINDSTFHVKNPRDGQTEYASMAELTFTQDEYDNYIKPKAQPEANIVSDKEVKAVREGKSIDVEDEPAPVVASANVTKSTKDKK